MGCRTYPRLMHRAACASRHRLFFDFLQAAKERGHLLKLRIDEWIYVDLGEIDFRRPDRREGARTWDYKMQLEQKHRDYYAQSPKFQDIESALGEAPTPLYYTPRFPPKGYSW
jgi:hypothetical protein